MGTSGSAVGQTTADMRANPYDYIGGVYPAAVLRQLRDAGKREALWGTAEAAAHGRKIARLADQLRREIEARP